MSHSFEDHCWQDIVSSDIFRIYEAYSRSTYIGLRPAILVSLNKNSHR